MTATETPAYDRLVSLIHQRHDGDLSDQDAHRLARNLMGYCELVIRANRNIPSEILDAEKENA